MDYQKINEEIQSFVAERDWDQFHSPKNLSMALSVEASELVEIFQWLNDKDIDDNKDKIHQAVKDEVVDIFYYVVRMCQKMDINLEDAFYEKMKKNKMKYPSNLYKGKSSL